MNNGEEIVRQFIGSMFGNLRISHGYIDTLFDCPLASLDEEALWSSFLDIAQKEIFKRSAGDITLFNDYGQAVLLQTAIAQQWPEAYFLDKLVQAGIVHRFETDTDESTFAVKEDYIPVLNAILTEVDIREGS